MPRVGHRTTPPRASPDAGAWSHPNSGRSSGPNQRGREWPPGCSPPAVTSAMRLGRGQFDKRGADGGDRLERALSEHVLGELEVELVFERQHDVDAGVRRHPGLKEIVPIAYARHVDRETTMFAQDLADFLVHHRAPSDASS